MNGLILVLSSLGFSAAAFWYLCATDGKRLRAWKVARSRATTISLKRWRSLAWLAALAPGIALCTLEQYPAFIMWFAAAPIVAWWLVLCWPTDVARK
ncbi:hypothetical protein OLMES_5509 [Oleiphilus messinensis]|uniref:DUF3325 domain-containing protein n=1 Tax=Oleiphilus messinensis TaxID=141451 RepID=A0A1Y0IH75_9GAMM|nr:hypothetical protein OLMES_5509 [Oleiphilus messinensis]